jgi:hypothetical protein
MEAAEAVVVVAEVAGAVVTVVLAVVPAEAVMRVR